MRTYLSNPDPAPSHKRCIFCKSVYPTALFSSSTSPACIQPSRSNALHTNPVELPDRFCSWHVRRLAKVINTGAGGQNKWVSQMKDMCMHCGVVQGWSDCACRCDSCGVRPVRTYTRYLNNERECRQFWFWRDVSTPDQGNGISTSGALFVREACFEMGMWTSFLDRNVNNNIKQMKRLPNSSLTSPFTKKIKATRISKGNI